MEKVGKQLSGQDWELMIDDFQSGSQQKWLSQYPGLAILELALYTVVKKDYNFPLKSQLITLVEENADVLIADGDADEGLGSVVEVFKAIVQAPIDGVMVIYALKEQMMVAATSVMIVADSLHRAMHHLEALVELLVGVINRSALFMSFPMTSSSLQCRVMIFNPSKLFSNEIDVSFKDDQSILVAASVTCYFKGEEEGNLGRGFIKEVC